MARKDPFAMGLGVGGQAFADVAEYQKALSPRFIKPPPPIPDDVLVEDAKRKQRMEDLRRRGRRASILTSASGIEQALGIVNRPQARAAELLG